MNSKVKVLSIVSISALLLMIILWAAGVFKSGPESYLEDTSCTYCPGANYLEFFESNFDEENLTIKMYQSKAKTEIIRVNAIEPKKDTTLFFFEVSVDSLKSVDPLIFLKMKVKGNDYPANSAYVKDYFSRRCANVQVDGSDSHKLLPDDYPFPVRLDSIMKSQNMIFTDDIKLTDSVGRAWKYVIKENRYGEIKVSPYYNKKPFNGYIYTSSRNAKIGDIPAKSDDQFNIEAQLIGYSNGKKSGLTYKMDGFVSFDKKYTRNYSSMYSYNGRVVWKNSILQYVEGELLKELNYQIVDYDFWKGRKYGMKYKWDLNFSPTSRQHVIESSHYKNAKKHGLTVHNYKYGWFSKRGSIYGEDFDLLKLYFYSKKNITRVENYNEDHLHEKGSYSYGKPSGEWIEYYFNGEIKKRITYNNKGEEMKHIEYDKEGLIKSNTGYKN